MNSLISVKRNYKSQITNYQSQRGYVLLTLMLFVALLSIAALAVLPEVKQQIQRDREDEMRHRGTQYMRAIKAFYKKNNRYPTRIEELEGTNNIRYLRKRFKDPMSRDRESHKEKDFKLLRTGDPELARLYSGQMPGIGGIAPGVGGALNGGNPQSPFGGPQSPTGGVPNGASPQAGPSQGQNVTPSGDDADENDNENGTGNQGQSQNNPTVTSSSPNGVGGPLQSNAAGGNSPSVFGGGPIMGVVSTSKEKSIREFGDKIKHYNEWLFVYDPTADRGGLIVGPVVPSSNTKGGIGGIPAGTLATQSQGNPTQVQPPAQPPQQNPTPQMPPDQEEP